MNRRKFIKILSWMPIGFLIPKIPFLKAEPPPIIGPDVKYNRELKLCQKNYMKDYKTYDADGGFIIPSGMAMQMQKDLQNLIIAKKFKIPMMKRGKIRR